MSNLFIEHFFHSLSHNLVYKQIWDYKNEKDNNLHVEKSLVELEYQFPKKCIDQADNRINHLVEGSGEEMKEVTGSK